MNTINYKLDTTNELLTSRIGLITPAHTIQVLDLSKTIDQHFPALGSNCVLKASTFIDTLVLSQHEGGELQDILTKTLVSFLSHLCGGEHVYPSDTIHLSFLSHLCGGEL